jgi:4-hydroxy-L-threonine phosphate dehydrogenase PdxA
MTNVQTDPIKIGITHGDFNGIGYEIILKVINDKRLFELFTPIIYGSSKIASYYRKAFDLDEVNFNLIKKADYANPKKPNIINIYTVMKLKWRLEPSQVRQVNLHFWHLKKP